MPELFTENDVRRLVQAAGTTRACELGYKTLGVDAAVEAAEAAQETGLTKLNIYRASLGDDATVAMMPRLGRNTCLTELSLGYNAIGDGGAAAIGRMLCNNSVLRKLVGVCCQTDDNIQNLPYALSLLTNIVTQFIEQEKDFFRDKKDEFFESLKIHFKDLCYNCLIILK